jgi:hypothetical protein
MVVNKDSACPESVEVDGGKRLLGFVMYSPSWSLIAFLLSVTGI